ncbi:DUF4390 domain-containing protein [Thiofilum flexile]|uniref:DUF4390 domain-containing protein n=1 Tax=Thiofilum flexile TaxID=125627 RepID=UPI00036A990E|nr:DUF4390 domain-containing protein [Thiofilum flexile]
MSTRLLYFGKLFLWLPLWLMILITPAKAEDEILLKDFVITTAGSPRQLVANVSFDYQLNSYLREGLLNGVTLRQAITFDLMWENNWFWNTTRPLDRVETELQYHALSQHYQLIRLDTQEHWNFTSLASALDYMGTLENYKLPLLPANALGSNASIVMQVTLTPKSPALPLKLRLLFTEDYAIESQGVKWPLP